MFFPQPEIRVASDPAASPVDITSGFPTDRPEQEEGREEMSCGEALGRRNHVSLIPGTASREKKRIESVEKNKAATTVCGSFGRPRSRSPTDVSEIHLE